MRIERILCPVDLPSESDEAWRYAVSLARAYQAELVLCHCAPPSQLITSHANGAAFDGVRKALADSLLRYVCRSDPTTPRCEVVVVDSGGDVGETIVRTARERRTDLVVMRSRRSGIAALLGSKAEQVSRTASCPVLVIHPSESANGDGDATSPARFQRILVSHDFSVSSELALSYALSIARRYRAELHLMHVLPAPKEDELEIVWNGQSVESAYQRATRRLRNSVPEDIHAHCRVRQVVRWGRTYREVLAYAKEQNIDLVCMGALGRDFGSKALFGSNVDRVLRQSTCPVLIGRPLKPATTASLASRIAKPSFTSAFVSAFLTFLSL